MNEFTAHHPVLHTLIIKLFIKIGLLVKNSYSFGVGLYSFWQIEFMSMTFASVLIYMIKRNVNKYFIILSGLFFMVYPVMPIYGITMWKDVPFALVMVWYSICVLEIIHNKDRFINSKLYNVLFILIIFLVESFRNNGIYVIVFSAPFIILYNKKYWKRLTCIFFMAIIIYKVLNGPVLSMLNIKKGSIREALSVPLQQLARVEINKRDMLTKEEYETIHKFIKCDHFETTYKTWLSDPIKDCFNEEYFKKNKFEFVKIWIKLFIKYPIQYFEAFFDNSVGYWYPEIDYMIVSRNIWNFEDGVKIKTSPFIEGKILRKYDSLIDKRNLPIITLFFSIGFNVWIMIASFGYCIYQRKNRLIMAYVPLLALWFTTLASPLYAEYRYIFSLFTCIPLIIAFTYFRSNRKGVD